MAVRHADRCRLVGGGAFRECPNEPAG
jgi:hypothetical protein